MVKITTKEQFAQVVFDQYACSGKPATFQELAEYAGCSVSVLRKIFQECNTCVPGVDDIDVSKPVLEKDYGTVRCYRNVRALVPTRRYMREKYKELQKLINDEHRASTPADAT